MQISNNEQLYSTVRAIITALHAHGDARAASDLRDALTLSTLPGEILGETRLALRAIRANDATLPEALRRDIHTAIAYIESVLGA